MQVRSLGELVLFHLPETQFSSYLFCRPMFYIAVPDSLDYKESWTVKKAEHRRTDAVELQC